MKNIRREREEEGKTEEPDDAPRTPKPREKIILGFHYQ